MNRLASTLHDATHLVPGVPEHRDRPRVHQGTADHSRSAQHRPSTARALQRRGVSAQRTRTRHRRPPRILIGWQRRVASLFTRQRA